MKGQRASTKTCGSIKYLAKYVFDSLRVMFVSRMILEEDGEITMVDNDVFRSANSLPPGGMSCSESVIYIFTTV